MLGIFGFMSASKVPGSVPVPTFIPPYDGNYMIPRGQLPHAVDDVRTRAGRAEGAGRGLINSGHFDFFFWRVVVVGVASAASRGALSVASTVSAASEQSKINQAAQRDSRWEPQLTACSYRLCGLN